MPQNVCRYYKFGYCKFGEKCRNLHIEEKCENKQCDITNCDKRHPRPFTEIMEDASIQNIVNMNMFIKKTI